MKFKTNDDVILHYTDTGDEDKPALIGIPGIGGSCQMWQDLIALFKNDYRFIMLDPRNQGQIFRREAFIYPFSRNSLLAHSRRCCLVSLFSFCVSCFKGIAISFGNNTPLIESIPCLQAVRYVFYGRVYSIICSLVHITLLCLHYK